MSFIEVARAALDQALTKWQRQTSLSNHRRVKLADSIDALVYYTLAMWHVLSVFELDELVWLCFKKSERFDYDAKTWFTVTIAYWLSSSIRNIQQLAQHLRGYDNDYTITPLIYLTFITYGYCSEYYKGALLLVNLHYATDAVYHVCGICWIGGWKGACLWSFRVWSLLFVTTRVIILEWSFHTNDTFFCIVQVALSIWLFWSFTVLHLAKLGYIKSERNFNASGELKLKTPRLFRPWIKKKSNDK